MKSLFALALLIQGYNIPTDGGLISIDNEAFIEKRDTVTTASEDEIFMDVKSNDGYVCSETERPTLIAKSGTVMLKGKVIPLQVDSLYNIGEEYQNVHYFKYRRIKNKEYLFAKLGPSSCVYHVVWKKEKNRFVKKSVFRPSIDFDVFLDESNLKERLLQY